MNNYDVKRFALVLAVEADIKGMMYENIARASKGLSIVYGVEEFGAKADELRNLAHCHDEQL